MRVGWAMPILLAPAPLAAAPVDYVRHVKPLLKERCFACHGALNQQAKLRLDSGAAILHGGKNGPVVVAGDADASLLLERVADARKRMPPEGAPLTDKQIATLRAWVEQGAKYPATDKPEADPRDHWAFRVLVRP